MDSAMDFGVILRFLARTLGVFALIFIAAVLTPWLARQFDKWMARYRKHHDPEQDETYGVRSIYDLPPKREESPEALDVSTEDRLASADTQELPAIPRETPEQTDLPLEAAEALPEQEEYDFDEEYDDPDWENAPAEEIPGEAVSAAPEAAADEEYDFDEEYDDPDWENAPAEDIPDEEEYDFDEEYDDPDWEYASAEAPAGSDEEQVPVGVTQNAAPAPAEEVIPWFMR